MKTNILSLYNKRDLHKTYVLVVSKPTVAYWSNFGDD